MTTLNWFDDDYDIVNPTKTVVWNTNLLQLPKDLIWLILKYTLETIHHDRYNSVWAGYDRNSITGQWFTARIRSRTTEHTTAYHAQMLSLIHPRVRQIMKQHCQWRCSSVFPMTQKLALQPFSHEWRWF